VLPGDTCRTAIGLAFGGGSVEVRGGVSADYRADSAVRDYRGEDKWVTVFYRVQVATEGGLNADVTPDGFLSDARVRIYGGSCDALIVRSLEGRSLRDVYVTPGTYYVAVRVDTFATRTFTLKLSRSESSRAVGNHCDKPEPLPVGAAGGSQAVVEGTTVGLHPVLPDACDESWPPQPDKVYELVLRERSHVLLEVRSLDDTSAFDIAVAQDCLTEGQCPSRPLPRETFVWQQGPMEPGRYFVRVRGNRAPGPFWFRATVTPWPANDTCAAPTLVPFVNGALELRGDLRFTGEGGNVCHGSVRQLHYRLSTRGLGARSLVVDVGREGEGGTVFAALSTECPTDAPAPTTRVACAEGDGDPSGPKHLEVPYLPEGDYFLQVYAFYSDTRLFQLRAALGPAWPPPANDTCAGAVMLTPDASGHFSATGDTRGANANHSDYCSGQADEPRPGRDVVFQVPGPARGRLEVTVRPTSAGYDPVLFVDRSSSCSTTSSGECANAAGVGGEEHYGQKIEQTGFSHPFTLWVDGRGGTEGTFSLSGRLILPPANDVCAQAQTLTPGGAAVQGSLEAVYSDGQLGCGIPYGPDLFYAFTAPSNGTAVVTLQPTGFDGVLAAGSLCDSSSFQNCVGSVNAAGNGGQETLSFAVTRNTRYLVRVGGSNLESDGTFSLSLRMQ
jgi:hypothetical protein